MSLCRKRGREKEGGGERWKKGRKEGVREGVEKERETRRDRATESQKYRDRGRERMHLK